MANVLTKQEVKCLEKIMNKKGFAGKKEIDYLIWRNTTEPKYEIGTPVKVTNTAVSICGERVKEWNGKVKRSFSFNGDKVYRCEVEISYKVNGVEKVTTVCSDEDKLKLSDTTESGKEFEYNGKYYESIDVYI